MRGKTTALLFFLSVLIALAGCASTGGMVAGLKKGDTTMEEVKAKFGEPNSRTAGQDGDVWVYKFLRDTREGDRHHSELDLKITFKNRTVEDYQVTVSELLEKPGARDAEPRPMPRRLPPPPPPGRPPF